MPYNVYCSGNNATNHGDTYRNRNTMEMKKRNRMVKGTKGNDLLA